MGRSFAVSAELLLEKHESDFNLQNANRQDKSGRKSGISYPCRTFYKSKRC